MANDNIEKPDAEGATKSESNKPEFLKILPTLTNDEVDPREDDYWRRDAEMLRDRPPHHG